MLAREKLVGKNENLFALTSKAKCIMPYIHKSNDACQLPLPCVAVIIMKNKKILIRTKTTEPGIGKKIFVGGKINVGEDLFESARRHVMEKVGLEIKNLKLICINSYIFRKQDTLSHFLVSFITAEPKSKFKNPKDSKFYSPKSIKGKLFPDNRFVISKMLHNKRVKVLKTFYDEDLDKFKLVNIS
jgi:ADP-ribose pyrophosphatase YjhB (NUDIX family)